MNTSLSRLLLFFLSMTMTLAACDEASDQSSNSTNECDTVNAEDFKDFLGLSYGMPETKVDDILGTSTGGEYVSDSSRFIFYYNGVDRVPLSIWTNGENTAVETVFIEVLSAEEQFEADKTAAIEKYDLDPCDIRYMGMTSDQIIAIMGQPDDKRTLEKGVRQIAYDTEDYSCNVCFKFYEKQGDICSSIRVTWFY